MVPLLKARRHRESLRALVQRSTSLLELLERHDISAFDDDLGTLIDISTVAASRLDEIDQLLVERGLASDSDRTLEISCAAEKDIEQAMLAGSLSR